MKDCSGCLVQLHVKMIGHCRHVEGRMEQQGSECDALVCWLYTERFQDGCFCSAMYRKAGNTQSNICTMAIKFCT